jgi:hypothetical protein
MATGVPLSEFVGRAPAMGINSGFNDAYYIDDDTRRRLIDEHPDCENLIKRFLRGRDLKRWTFNWERTWHIVLPSSLDQSWPWAKANTESEAEEVFRTAYPSLYRHLSIHEDILRRRTARGKFWWELRSCEYYADYETPKILVQGIAYYSQFAFDPAGCYINNMVAFIPSSDLYLLAILNSRVTWWLINHTFQPRKDGGRSLDIQHLLALPIPDASADLRHKISAAVTSLIRSSDAERVELEHLLNTLLQDAFQLSSAEASVLERSLPPRDPIALLPAVVAAKSSGVAAPVAQPMLVPSLGLVASGAWATPPGIQPSNFVLLAVTEVLHRCRGPVDPHRVWMAVHFVRNPAMALAFLDKARMRDWARVIGPGAQPVQKNVIDISRFRRGATDQLWGDAIIYLKSIGALVESSGQWSVTSAALSPADEEWLAGRAEIAVQLASKLADEEETELRLVEFLRSVEDGTARRAVS